MYVNSLSLQENMSFQKGGTTAKCTIPRKTCHLNKLKAIFRNIPILFSIRRPFKQLCINFTHHLRKTSSYLMCRQVELFTVFLNFSTARSLCINPYAKTMKFFAIISLNQIMFNYRKLSDDIKKCTCSYTQKKMKMFNCA